MPLTQFQSIILKLLAKQRTPESHIAGGIAINQSETSPRFSKDIDIFHDSNALALKTAIEDAKLLENAGYQIEWQQKLEGFCRIKVSLDKESILLEWVYDSVFRFFPVITDDLFGYRLHPFDIATNKVLAAASRKEPRDFVDILFLHDTYLHLGAIIWAACGKDPGFSPQSIIEHIDRNKAISPPEFARLQLTRPLDPELVRNKWITLKAESEAMIEFLPIDSIGCVFLDPKKLSPVKPDTVSVEKAIRHFGSIRGAWPKLVES